MPLTPAERSMRASIAAHTRWSRTPVAERRRQGDRGQAALLAKFADELDPHHLLRPDERNVMAQNAMTAHMKRLALKSAKVRRGEAA